MIDEGVHLQDAAPQVAPFCFDAFFERLHGRGL
jgi:hypothetical protein